MDLWQVLNIEPTIFAFCGVKINARLLRSSEGEDGLYMFI